MIDIGFVVIFKDVIRPPNATVAGPRRKTPGRPAAATRLAVAAAAGWLILGCREAATPTGPTPKGPDFSAPAVVTRPGQDTTVDSIGLLNIEVLAHDAALIDTVTLLISGAPFAFPASTVHDTVADLFYTVALGGLHHRSFSYRVAAGDVLGHDTVTDSVTVRLR